VQRPCHRLLIELTNFCKLEVARDAIEGPRNQEGMPPLQLHPEQPTPGLSLQAETEWYRTTTRQLSEDCPSRMEKHKYLASENRKINAVFSFITWFVSLATSAPLVTYLFQQNEAKSKGWGITSLTCTLSVSFLYSLQAKADYQKTRFEHEQAEQSFHAFMQSVTYHLLADPAARRDAFSISLLLLSQKSNVNSRAPPIYEDDTSRASRYWHVLTAFVFFKSSHTSSSGA